MGVKFATERLDLDATALGGGVDGSDLALLNALCPGANWKGALLACGGMVGLIQASDERLGQWVPCGAVAALRAGLALTGRFQQARDSRPTLHSPGAIHEWMAPQVAHLRVENFVVLCLSVTAVLVHQETVAVGSVDLCAVDPRRVFGVAFRIGTPSIVVVHNHPSGNPEPSQADVALTHQLREVGQALSIRVIDHLVIGRQGFVSLAARGVL